MIRAHVLSLADGEEPVEDLLVGEARVADDGASALDWLDDLGGGVAGQGKAGGCGVELHCAAESLLGARCHAAGEGGGGTSRVRA